MSDFWRGYPLGQTQYGDSINYTSPGVPPPAPLSVKNKVTPPLQRHQTMSAVEDEEMAQLFA